jgi:O-antigen ligase
VLRFGLFILTVAMLFLRPAELIPGLEDAPIYEVVILAAIAAAARPIIGQLSPQSIAARPITAFVLGMLAAVILSHLARFSLADAYASGFKYLKVVLLYLLVTANVRTLRHLRMTLLCFGGLMCCQVTLGLLGYYGYLEIEALKAFQQQQYDQAGELELLPRLCGAGIFNDPNDLCVLLAIGVILSLYFLGDRRAGVLRFAALIPLAVFSVAIPLTHSRGGLLAVLAGLGVLAADRLGPRAAAALGVLGLLGLLVVGGGRMTQFDVGKADDTSQSRMRAWSDGLLLLRSSPLFGIGHGLYADVVGIDAHNSFVHAYTELGLLGGTCFFGLFAYAGWVLWKLRRHLRPATQPTLYRLRSYLLAIVATLATGLFSLSRVDIPTVYLVFGLCAAYLGIVASVAPGSVPRLTKVLVARVAVFGGLLMLLIHLLVISVVQWS